MSKRVKSLIERGLGNRFKDVEAVAVINPRGIGAIKNNNIRRKLREQGMRMTAGQSTLSRLGTATTKINQRENLLDGPSAVIYGKGSMSSIARLLIEEKKADE